MTFSAPGASSNAPSAGEKFVHFVSFRASKLDVVFPVFLTVILYSMVSPTSAFSFAGRVSRFALQPLFLLDFELREFDFDFHRVRGF